MKIMDYLRFKKIYVGLAIFFVCGALSISGQSIAPKLVDRPITIKMEHQPLGNVFRELIYSYHVQIGFEESVLDRDHDDYIFETNASPYSSLPDQTTANGQRVSLTIERTFYPKEHWFTVNVKDEPLGKVLDLITKQLPNYKWEINDDIINFIPVSGRDVRYKNLLELKVGEFTVEKGNPLGTIRNNLLALPEIVTFLRNNKIHSSAWRGDIEYVLKPLPMSIKLENIYFRDLLNRITKLKGSGGWILRHTTHNALPGQEFIDIQI